MMKQAASPADLSTQVRLFPLAGAILLPRRVLPLNIFEPRYLAMVRDAMSDDQMIAMIQPRDHTEPPPLYEVGSLGRITRFSETGDGRLLIALTGITRFRLVSELPVSTPYRQAVIDHACFESDWGPADSLASIARVELESTLKTYLEAHGLAVDWEAVKSADDESLVCTLSTVCPFDVAERQALLEARNTAERAQTLTALMRLSSGSGEGQTMQ